MTVSAEYLADHAEDVLTALSNGETIEVARAAGGTLRLVASTSSEETRDREVNLGSGAGAMRSVSWEDWQQIDRDWKSSFLNDADVA